MPIQFTDHKKSNSVCSYRYFSGDICLDFTIANVSASAACSLCYDVFRNALHSGLLLLVETPVAIPSSFQYMLFSTIDWENVKTHKNIKSQLEFLKIFTLLK